MRRFIFAIALAVVCVVKSVCAVAQSVPLPNAFAHNDYSHKRPLHDALANGYTNVEADVFLMGKNLVVAHINPFFKGKRNLEKLYLQPLLEQIIANDGQVYKNYDQPIILLIDIKTEANSTYAELKPLLEKYRPILTSYDNGQITLGAVTIVISGHKPNKMLASETNRLAFIDTDLRQAHRNKDTTSNNIYTMASCKYSKLVKWNGLGLFPQKEKERLQSYVDMAHTRGEKVRLWASPENQAVWGQLLSCGVDLINTNKLVALKQFLTTKNPSPKTDLKPAIDVLDLDL